MRTRWMGVALLLLAAALATGAEAAEQRAFALEDPVTLYAKPDKGAKSWEASLPESGVSVPSAIRDKQDMLWYKVKVDGKTGWLFQEGIRLKMGPKSKSAVNIYKRYVAARRKIAGKAPKNWTQQESTPVEGAEVETWSTSGAVLQTLGEGSKAEDVYFKTNSAEACKTFLGFEAIGMSKDELRTKVGTPTVRETPSGEPELSILSYEFADGDMTLAFTLRSQIVEQAELYKGSTGEADADWPTEVLNLRSLD